MAAAGSSRRRWMLLLSLVLLAPALGAAALMLWRSLTTEALLPDLDPSDIARVQIVRMADGVKGNPLVLERLPGSVGGPSGWRIASAADAPADSRRIDAMLQNLRNLRGQPAANDQAIGSSRLEVHLFDNKGHPVATAAFHDTVAARLPDGANLRIGAMPALPDWPSAWTSLKAPKIDVSHIIAVERSGPDGAERLPPAAVGQTVAVLLALDAQDFTAGRDVRWLGARNLRVIMDNGATIDLQQIPDGEGRYFLRMTSDQLAHVHAARRFAFRVARPIP